MFKAIQVGKHGGPEMMKVVTNASLPSINSSQVKVRIRLNFTDPSPNSRRGRKPRGYLHP